MKEGGYTQLDDGEVYCPFNAYLATGEGSAIGDHLSFFDVGRLVGLVLKFIMCRTPTQL